jgi:hypothetical protein
MARDVYCRDDIRNGIVAALKLAASARRPFPRDDQFMRGIVVFAVAMCDNFGIEHPDDPWQTIWKAKEEGGRDTHNPG